MYYPTTISDIDQLINNKVQENIHLDYKDSRAVDPKKSDEIAKDASAFANSDGGVIIYGVAEDNNHFHELVNCLFVRSITLFLL